MAIKFTEIPAGLDAGYWFERDNKIDRLGRKTMDLVAGIPLDQIPGSAIRQNQANFAHYSTMMEQGSRSYIWTTLRYRLFQHMQDHTGQEGSYTLLDGGAGNGRVAKKLAPLLRESFPGGTELILAERSAPALDSAHHYFATAEHYRPLSDEADTPFAPLYHFTRGDEAFADQTVTFLHEDLNRLSLPDGSVDAIACMMVLHHQKLAEMVQTLSELERVLKPEGIAVLIDTGALPERGWQRFIVPKVVKIAISPGKMLAHDKRAGIHTGEAEMRGYQDFGKRDGLLAFDFAVDQTHWQELMEHSALGRHLTEVRSFNTPNPVVSRVFPDLNLAVAIKRS